MGPDAPCRVDPARRREYSGSAADAFPDPDSTQHSHARSTLELPKNYATGSYYIMLIH